MTENADHKGLLLESAQLKLPTEHCDRVVDAQEQRTLAYEAVLEPHTGDAFLMKPGQVIRVEQRHETTQICD
ncbi:MAG: hypothetical protein ACR2QO_25595 [Acidimicrobiales bacterium]